MNVSPLVINRHFNAPPERVFAAFTDRELTQGWYGPETMTSSRCEVDARVGGAYRVEMHRRDGNVAVVTGVFTQIEAPRKLALTWG